MADMIKFYKGLEANLPASGANGALYITTDEGGIYLGTGTGMKRLGDFVQVANVDSLPEKAHENCLYYCVAENILAKWNGTEWKQVNKQPTTEELKTLLGLGSMAYVSEVAESNLSAALAEKVNAAADGNHSHANKSVLDGISAEKVAAWDAAEQNAKDYADGLDEAMDTRVKAVEDAIGENGSVAAQIKTAIEELDFTDTAVDGEYVSAVNEVDGKISVTRKALPDYTNTYDAKGAAETAFENAKAYADGLAANYDEKGAAAGVKTELEAEIAKKVDKVEGKSLISDTEIARLATLSNYDDTEVKADIAKKADAETVNTELGKKVDKVDGYSLVSDEEIARLADVDNYDDTALAGRVSTAEGKITALEGTSATKEELGAVDAKFTNYVTTESYATDKAATEGALADRYTKGEADEKFAIKGADAYDDTELAGRVSTAEGKIADLESASATHAVKTEVEAALALKADKSALEETDATLAEVKEVVDNFFAEDAAIEGAIDTLKEIANYIATDKEGAADITARVGALEGKVDVDKVSTAISTAVQAEAERATDAEGGLSDRIKTLEDNTAGYATTGEVATAKQEAIDAAATAAQGKVDALANGQVKVNTEAIATKANSADVYAKTETYTQAEVDALIEAAHSWGEF